MIQILLLNDLMFTDVRVKRYEYFGLRVDPNTLPN